MISVSRKLETCWQVGKSQAAWLKAGEVRSGLGQSCVEISDKGKSLFCGKSTDKSSLNKLE